LASDSTVNTFEVMESPNTVTDPPSSVRIRPYLPRFSQAYVKKV